MVSAADELGSLLAQGHKFRLGGDMDAAALVFQDAARRFAHSADAHHDLGGFLYVMGCLPEAEATLRRALDLAPNRAAVKHALAFVLLAQGKYVEGFALYEERHQMAHLTSAKPPLPYPEWRGEDLSGRRLLIWPEQGLGDQIQNARFAPLIAERGADVTLVCAPLLRDLFAERLGVRVIAAEGEIEFPDPDYWTMGMSLPGILGLTPETVPGGPYLHLPDRREKLGGIGIATRGAPWHANDMHRSLPSTAVEELRSALPDTVSLHPEDSGVRSFMETAEIISGLDLVITVDTSVAHLAGAMGKPIWILLAAIGTDWRWMRGRTDSPWYPTARLFRQSRPGDWSTVIADVSQALSARSN